MSNAPHYEIDVPTFWADPYPDLARMRKEAPIAFVPQLGSTVFTRRDDIFTQEKRIDVFSSHQPAGLMNRLMGHNMMRKDGDAHMSERAAMFPAVSPRTVQRHLDQAIPGACRPHPRRARADRPRRSDCKAFALPLSAECLKDITGLTNMRYQDMDAWSQAMIDGIANYTGDKRGRGALPCRDRRHRRRDRRHDSGGEEASQHVDPQRAACRRPADGQHPRQHQARDIGRTERAARRHLRHGVGAADASRSARAGARRARQNGSTCSRNTPAGSRRSRCRRDGWQSRGPIAASISSRRIACSSCSARPTATRPASPTPTASTSRRDTQKSIAFGAGPHYCAGAFASRAMVADVALPGIFARLKGLAAGSARAGADRRLGVSRAAQSACHVGCAIERHEVAPGSSRRSRLGAGIGGMIVTGAAG